MQNGTRSRTRDQHSMPTGVVDPIDAFVIRAEARAMLWSLGDLGLHEAVDELQSTAERAGLVARIGQNAVQAIMSDAFAPYRSAPGE